MRLTQLTLLSFSEKFVYKFSSFTFLTAATSNLYTKKMNKFLLIFAIIYLNGVFAEDDKYYFSYPLKVNYINFKSFFL